MKKFAFKTQFCSYSYNVYLVKMESGSEVTIFSLKMMIKRGLDFSIILPCGKKVILVIEFVIWGKNLPFCEVEVNGS